MKEDILLTFKLPDDMGELKGRIMLEDAEFNASCKLRFSSEDNGLELMNRLFSDTREYIGSPSTYLPKILNNGKHNSLEFSRVNFEYDNIKCIGAEHGLRHTGDDNIVTFLLDDVKLLMKDEFSDEVYNIFFLPKSVGRLIHFDNLFRIPLESKIQHVKKVEYCIWNEFEYAIFYHYTEPRNDRDRIMINRIPVLGIKKNASEISDLLRFVDFINLILSIYLGQHVDWDVAFYWNSELKRVEHRRKIRAEYLYMNCSMMPNLCGLGIHEMIESLRDQKERIFSHWPTWTAIVRNYVNAQAAHEHTKFMLYFLVLELMLIRILRRTA